VDGSEGRLNIRRVDVVMSHRPHGALDEGDHEDPLGLERDRKRGGCEIRLRPASSDAIREEWPSYWPYLMLSNQPDVAGTM
jgi:hypothetical protein